MLRRRSRRYADLMGGSWVMLPTNYLPSPPQLSDLPRFLLLSHVKLAGDPGQGNRIWSLRLLKAGSTSWGSGAINSDRGCRNAEEPASVRSFARRKGSSAVNHLPDFSYAIALPVRLRNRRVEAARQPGTPHAGQPAERRQGGARRQLLGRHHGRGNHEPAHRLALPAGSRRLDPAHARQPDRVERAGLERRW